MSRAFLNCREPINSYTHFCGAVASGVGMLLLVVRAFSVHASPALLGGALLFAVALILLYTASCVYHFSQRGHAVVARLQRVDHSMIYLLIAGSYTPFCIRFMPGDVCLRFLVLLWACALAGVIIKNCWMSMPRWLGTAIYLALGWAALTQWNYFTAMPRGCFLLVLLGGVLYSIGGIIYAAKKPNLSPNWGSHELFHLFILAASAAHFCAVFFYVL